MPYATDLAEHVAGLGTIAFPIRIHRTQVVYALGVTGPYSQIIENGFDANCRAIEETAKRLSRLLQLRSPIPASQLTTSQVLSDV